MQRAYHFRPCPHCGELMRPGTIARHTPYCVKNPVVYAHVREVLAGEDGKHGIPRGRYAELSAADKTLLTINTLLRRIETTSWGGVLAFFRLETPREPYRSGKCMGRPATKRTAPKPKPIEPQPAPVAYAIAPRVEQAVILPLPRIKPSAPASKWAGLKGYDPTWKAPTGDTQWLVMVQPGERTCLACGETFEPGGYCMRCSTRDDGTRRAPGDMPPSVATADYLRLDEYVTVR